MTRKPILSIGDFAQMSTLSAQTLRYYHRQGLLVPTEVDENTGYRGYTFDQTHQALLIVALRRAAVSIRDIRAVLEDPELLPGVLTEHRTKLDGQRNDEDGAIAEAWHLAKGWPITDIRDQPPGTAVMKQVAGEEVASGDPVVPQRIRSEAEALQRELIDAGAEIIGVPWCRYALQTPEDKAKAMTPEGPDWIIAVDLRRPEDGPGTLPSSSALRHCPDRRELAVHLPGAPTMVAYAAAIEYLTRICRDQDLIPDFNQLRHGLAHDHIELALAVTPVEHMSPSDTVRQGRTSLTSARETFVGPGNAADVVSRS